MSRLICLCLPALVVLAARFAVGQTLRVTDFGAVGDGKTVNTFAFQQALNHCAHNGGGEVLVPAGRFVIGSVFIGPRTTLRIAKDATLVGSPNKDDYPLTNIRWEGRWRIGHRGLIYAEKSDHIAIVGEGTIIGDTKLAYLREPRGPAIIEPVQCRDVRIDGISIRYERMWTVHLVYCQDVVVRGLNIRTTPRPSNGDGIDVDSCRNVLIENCDIDAGDDAIAVKSGRGMEAVRIARPTENLTIRNCTLGSTFAGIGIGTEMSGGIRNVTIDNCTFTRGVNAIYIKSRTGRGGFIENIVGTNLRHDGPQHFLHIDLVTKGIQDSQPVEGVDAFPRVKNLRFQNIHVQNCRTLLQGVRIAPEQPVVGLTFTDITGTCERAINIANMRDVELVNINVSGFAGEKISAVDVTGLGVPATRPATNATSAP